MLVYRRGHFKPRDFVDFGTGHVLCERLGNGDFHIPYVYPHVFWICRLGRVVRSLHCHVGNLFLDEDLVICEPKEQGTRDWREGISSHFPKPTIKVVH